MLNIKRWQERYFHQEDNREPEDPGLLSLDEASFLMVGSTTEDESAFLTEDEEFLQPTRKKYQHNNNKYDQDSNIKLFRYNKPALWKRILTRCPYYFLPISLWLPSYAWRENLIPDIITGIGIGCMIIPQSLAYALLAGVDPIVGLYAAWMPVYVFACLTTSRHASFGPDALGALLVGLYIEKHHDVDSNQMAAVFSFMCGLICVTMGVFRLGFLDNILSRPLLSGFVNAVAIIIIILQLNPMFGIPQGNAHDSTWNKLVHFFSNISSIQWTTFLIGVLCLFILFGIKVLRVIFPEFKAIKYFIGPLIVVVIGIILSYTMDLGKKGVVLLGEVSSDFPYPSIPNMDMFTIQNLLDNVVICVIGFVETIVAVKIYAKKHNYSISPNRELVALGMANFIGSFFHTYPAFGSLPRSAMADFLGNKTQIYSFVTGTMVLLTILFLNKVFYHLPRVVMSSIIFMAACSLFEVEDIFFFYRIRAWLDIAMLVVTFLVTLILGVDNGIIISVGISILIILKHTTFPHISILGKNMDGQYVDVYLDRKAKIIPGISIVRIDEALYFANMEQVKDMFKRIETFGTHYAHPTDQKEDIPTRAIIVHARNITQMDASAMQILLEMMEDYEKNNVFVCFVKLPSKLKKPFLETGIIDSQGGNRVFPSIEEALAHIHDTINSGNFVYDIK